MVWSYSKIIDRFLTYIGSCTFADLSDEELTNEMVKFLERALADFRFPQCSLDVTEQNDDYYFTDEDFGEREVNVIISYMNKYFLGYILHREKNFEQQYYDSDTKTHSLGNLVQQMDKVYKQAVQDAEDANYNYSRMSRKRLARIGSVYD